MRGKIVSGLVLALLFTSILLLAFEIQPSEAAISPYSPAGAVSIEPSTATVGENQTVTVKVIITNITNTAGYQIEIYYNSTLLSLDSWTVDTDPANPLSPTQMAPALGGRVDVGISTPGTVSFATVWTAATPLYTYLGDSVAAEITFKGEMVGSSSLMFNPYWTRATDTDGEDILFGEFNNGAITVVQVRSLTILSLPSGVAFTADGGPHTTPWSGIYGEGTSVNLEMPSTHGGHFWSHWLEDGDPNRMRTVVMDANITLTGVYKLPEFVGGKAIPIVNPTKKLELLAPYTGITMLLAIAAVAVVYVKKRKKA